jgi:acyl-CoA synthetase (AMP-forming)/AMP-acid ligase II/acyl carrier protein
MAYSFLSDNPDPVIRESESLVEIISKRAKLQPESVVYRYLGDGVNETESFTFKEIDRVARSVAQALSEKLNKGDRVLLLFPQGLQYVAALYGCFYGGFIAIPAYPPRRNRKMDRINSIIEDSGAAAGLVTGDVFKTIERNFADDELLKKMEWFEYEKISSNPNPLPLTTLPQPDDTAFIQYTSGSTGNPKGVMITHKNIIYNSDFIRRSFGFDKNTVGMNWLPIFHDMGLVGGIFQAAFLGLINIGMPPVAFLKNPLNWLKAIDKYKATTGGGPNFSYDYCIQKIKPEETANLDLSTIKNFYCGGEPVRKKTFVEFPKTFANARVRTNQMFAVYGMAETTLIVTGGDPASEPKYVRVDQEALSKNRLVFVPEDKKGIDLVSNGHVWMETAIKIVNPDTFEPVDENGIGEVWISGPTVAKGYWNKPEENKRTFNAHLANGDGPWLRSGDLGFLFKDELYITGRLKDLIIIRGVNHYPNDIEYSVQQSHEAFKPNSGAAFSIHKEGVEKLVIVQELERNYLRNTDFNELMAHIRKTVADNHELEVYSVALIRTGSIPLTSSGKIQRRQTRYEFLTGKLNVVASWQPDDEEPEAIEPQSVQPTEEAIKEWLTQWIMKNQHFKREEIDPDTPITSYGIDSLAAVTLEQEISTRFGFQWHVSYFMLNPTINKLAKDGMELYREENKNMN